MHIDTVDVARSDIFCMLLNYQSFPNIVEDTPIDPCNPSPCGPNSQCREINGHAVCSCAPGNIGMPPTCRPECVVSSECPQDKACINQKCNDPCPGTCGQNARCQVINHNPICSCSNGYTGDPFVRCIQETSKICIFNTYIIHFLFCYYKNNN